MILLSDCSSLGCTSHQDSGLTIGSDDHKHYKYYKHHEHHEHHEHNNEYDEYDVDGKHTFIVFERIGSPVSRKFACRRCPLSSDRPVFRYRLQVSETATVLQFASETTFIVGITPSPCTRYLACPSSTVEP